MPETDANIWLPPSIEYSNSKLSTSDAYSCNSSEPSSSKFWESILSKIGASLTATTLIRKEVLSSKNPSFTETLTLTAPK